MATKITIQSGEGLFKFKDTSIDFFESRPKIYQLERYGALKTDQAKIPVIVRNLETGDFLFQGVTVDEIKVDGVTYETYEELSEVLTPILFSKGGGSGGGGTFNGITTQNSDTVIFTGNGKVGTPLIGKVKDIYSTTETLTGGIWIDGKPIYRKVFASSDVDNLFIVNNLDNLIYSDGYFKVTDVSMVKKTLKLYYSGLYNPELMPFSWGEYYLNDFYGEFETLITLRNGDVIEQVFLILEYTKTTDVAP